MRRIQYYVALVCLLITSFGTLKAYSLPITQTPDSVTVISCDSIYLGSEDAFLPDSLAIADSLEILRQQQIIGQTNVLKKALTLTKIAWTPLKPIANLPYGSKITAGDVVYGIPYSSCGQIDKFVGEDVSILTFMTAVNNPYSLLYTEDLYNNKSGYGFHYAHRKNGSLYYGITCSMLVKICLGHKLQHVTAAMPRFADKGFYTRPEKSAQELQIGDVLSKKAQPGHVRIIAGIIKDSLGTVTKIYCAESVEMKPKFNVWTPAQFDKSCEKYDLYRPTRLADNTSLLENDFFDSEKSMLVDYTTNNTPGVQKSSYKYNNDICTFAGDYASFRHGQPIFINYNLKEIGNWNKIELYNDSTEIGSFKIDKEDHSFDLTDMHLPCGKYKAQLTSGKKKSDFTYFEIIDTDATMTTLNGFERRIEFGTKYGTPLYIQFVYKSGGIMGTYELTDEDIEKGFVELNAAKIINNILLKTNIYWKMKYRGDYGTAISKPTLSDINML